MKKKFVASSKDKKEWTAFTKQMGTINYKKADFLDQNIDTINEFDKLTQKKIKKIKDKNIIINPSSELLLNNKTLNFFRKSFRKIFPDYRHSHIYNLFSESIVPSGGEHFLPLFNESMSTIFFYCSNFFICFKYKANLQYYI